VAWGSGFITVDRAHGQALIVYDTASNEVSGYRMLTHDNDGDVPLRYTNEVKTGEMCNVWGYTVGTDPVQCGAL
jgi:hypothetical protein